MLLVQLFLSALSRSKDNGRFSKQGTHFCNFTLLTGLIINDHLIKMMSLKFPENFAQVPTIQSARGNYRVRPSNSGHLARKSNLEPPGDRASAIATTSREANKDQLRCINEAYDCAVTYLSFGHAVIIARYTSALREPRTFSEHG